jgi:hypothetical protein
MSLALFLKSVTVPNADADFAARSNPANGVIRALKFNTMADIINNASEIYGASDSNPSSQYGDNDFYLRASADTAVKSSGTGSLKWTCPSVFSTKPTGDLGYRFTADNSVQFGEGDTFYVQFRMRFSDEAFRAYKHVGDGTYTSTAKILYVGMGDKPGVAAMSHSDLEAVVTLGGLYPTLSGGIWRPRLSPCFYQCGYEVIPYNNKPYENLSFMVGNDRVFTHNPTTPYRCLRYLDTTSDANDDKYNCCPDIIPNTWMTVKLCFNIGTWNTGSSRIRMWVAQEHSPSILHIDSNDGWPGSTYPIYRTPDGSVDEPAVEGGEFGKIWINTYVTEHDPTEVCGIHEKWIDEIIISTQDIADPA